jgi:hypothetical protein
VSEALAQQPRAESGHWASPYTNRAELVDEICKRLATGESLLSICRDPKMPGAFTVYDWAGADDETAQRIARAREIGEDAIAQDALSIIDGDKPIPNMIPDATRDKARADIRLKLLAKFNPKRWGESTQLRHADADGAKLDTAPMVSELLSLMAPGAANTSAPIPVKAELIEAPRAPKPAYRPRARAADSVDDLV